MTITRCRSYQWRSHGWTATLAHPILATVGPGICKDLKFFWGWGGVRLSAANCEFGFLGALPQIFNQSLPLEPDGDFPSVPTGPLCPPYLQNLATLLAVIDQKCCTAW